VDIYVPFTVELLFEYDSILPRQKKTFDYEGYFAGLVAYLVSIRENVYRGFRLKASDNVGGIACPITTPHNAVPRAHFSTLQLDHFLTL
jgi:hypothetical protein